MNKSVAEKMGIKPGTRAIVENAPESVIDALGLPALDIQKHRRGQFGYIHLFVETEAELDKQLPPLMSHLKTDGMLWVSWRKGKKATAGLTIQRVIRIAYSHGLVESTALRVDDTWSALKLTHPKPGKTYRNSYGTLPADMKSSEESH